MTAFNLLFLPGDGIGPEVMGEVKKVIDWINEHSSNVISIRWAANTAGKRERQPEA